MLRQRDDTSDALGAAALTPEEEGPAGSRKGGWRGASKWGRQGMAESRLPPLVVLGNVVRITRRPSSGCSGQSSARANSRVLLPLIRRPVSEQE